MSILSSPSPIGRGLVALSLAAGLGLGGLVLYDSWSTPEPDYAPVRQPSALDTWQPPWQSAGRAGEASENPPAAGPDAAACSTLPARWLVIGWDGADWDLVLPLLEAGRLPHLESLMRTGSYGTLHSIVPTLSPAIWTTVATGVDPGRHGILHFYNKKPRLERLLERAIHFGKLDRQLYSNADRRAPAIWNEMSRHGRDVLTVGYHNTFPVEEVNGLMVSNYLVQDSVAELMDMEMAPNDAGAELSELGGSLVYPPDHLREILDLQRRVNGRIPDIVQDFAQLEADEVTPFLRRSLRLDSEDQKPYYLVHAWLFDSVVAEIADTFLSRRSPHLAMIHFQAADWAAHRFLYFKDPGLFDAMAWTPETRAALAAEIPRYQHTVDAFYVFLDDWLGRLLEHRDEETGVLLLSDHGFEADIDPHIPGGHDSAPPGLVVIQGPGIRPDHRLDAASVYDILPTLMAGSQLPVAQDLDGEPIRDAFCDAAWNASTQTSVASYGSGRPFVPQISRPESLDREVLEQLESLGYLD